MINFISFNELADNTKRKISSFCKYSDKYLSRYDGIVKLIGKVMKEEGVVYSPELAINWVKNFIESNDYGDSTRWRYTRIVNLLNSNWNNELESWIIYPTTFHLSPTANAFKDAVSSFKKYLLISDYAYKTIDVRVFSANQFLCWAENNGYISFDDFSPLLISNYLSSNHFQNRKSGGVSTEIIGLRKFLVYLEDNKILQTICHNACLSKKNASKRIVTTYNKEQLKTLFVSLPHSLANLRNKAIFILALKCGLRSSDIMNLKFENIDFDNKKLNLIQQKTKEPIIIPFDNEVSNVLIDYILNERRNCDLPYVFVTVNGPVRRLTHTSSFQTPLHFKSSDKPAHGGLHILRRTYASNLLSNDVSVSTIASTLGHVDLSTIDRYLSTDEKRMKKCALNINSFPYNGGLF